MLIKWNGTGLMGTPLVNPASTTKGGEKTIIFLPGWNEIPDEWFDLLKDTLRDDIENKRIELYCKMEKDENGNQKYVGQALQDVRSDVARKIIAETFNLDVLKTWADNPKIDRDLRFYIDKQIDACEKGEARS